MNDIQNIPIFEVPGWFVILFLKITIKYYRCFAAFRHWLDVLAFVLILTYFSVVNSVIYLSDLFVTSLTNVSWSCLVQVLIWKKSLSSTSSIVICYSIIKLTHSLTYLLTYTMF